MMNGILVPSTDMPFVICDLLLEDRADNTALMLETCRLKRLSPQMID